jgi:hypothetical protein
MRRLLSGLAALVILGALAVAALLWWPFPRVVEAEPSASEAHPAVRTSADRILAVLFHDGTLYALEDHFLYASADTGRTYRQIGRLPKTGDRSPTALLRDRVARTEIVRDRRRYAGPRRLAVLSTGTILVFYDHVYRSTDGGRTFEAIPGTDDLPRGFPSSVGSMLGPGDTIYYGEYITEERPNTVRIVRGTDDGRTWEVAHTFEPGELFHIHAIAWDPWRRRWWVASGDVNDEPRLTYTEDNFATLEVAGCCRQPWRIVDLIITEDALFWGSDDDRDQPAIFRYDPAADSLTQLAELENPSYHAAILDGS